MKTFMQFGIIMGVSFLGNILKVFLPLPVPSAVWGMLLMFLFLCLGIIKLEQVETAADYLLEIMPVLFVPITVSVIENYALMKQDIVGILAISLITTLICFTVTGVSAQAILAKKRKGTEK